MLKTIGTTTASAKMTPPTTPKMMQHFFLFIYFLSPFVFPKNSAASPLNSSAYDNVSLIFSVRFKISFKFSTTNVFVSAKSF